MTMPNKSQNYDFIERLKYLINESGDNKKAFAKKCGISENQIYVYLKGKSEPGMGFFSQMKEQYSWINLNWLISGNDEPIVESKFESAVVAIDPAVSMVIDVENELGIKLNNKQRQAVVAVLRRELDRQLSEQKSEIADLISSFTNTGGT